MFLKLSKGEAKVRVWFGKLEDGRRTTNLQVTMLNWLPPLLGGDWDLKTETVVCSKQDNFCKRTGRKYVLNKFLYGHPVSRFTKLVGDSKPHIYWTDVFTAEDRGKLWRAVCPEFYRVNKRRTKQKDTKEIPDFDPAFPFDEDFEEIL